MITLGTGFALKIITGLFLTASVQLYDSFQVVHIKDDQKKIYLIPKKEVQKK